MGTRETLQRWGWNSYFAAAWNEGQRESALPARVIAQQRKFWRIAGTFGECWAEASGKLRMASEEGVEWPAVGDWVVADVREAGSSALILEVLPRRGQFVRKMAGKRIAEQVLAANVDMALLVSALDADFNPRRMERYLAQCWEAGAKPVIVLNKADACGDASVKAEAMERIALGVAVSVISARTGQGMEAVEKFLLSGETVVLLGSSGVGKSTIVNWLLGEMEQNVQPVREGDSRGRHTTTARELFILPHGALLMDTPGLRELQLWDAAQGIPQAFADMDALAAECRFGDCTHEGEPGCAVRAAVDAGTLDEARVESRRKLLREQEFLRRKLDPEARHKEKVKIRRVFRGIRQMTRQRETDGKS
jgi:ribosome biogenesis GTPase / thiamine phosphate phosphatase